MEHEKLEELLRQRRLIEEHLRWLDQQIAEAEGSSRSPVGSIRPPAATAPHPPSTSSTGEPLPLPALDRKNIRRSIARGCAFYIAVAAAMVFLLWLAYHLAS